MAPCTERGWLFDLYPIQGEMVIWFILENGQHRRLSQPYEPSLYLDIFDPALPEADLRALHADLKRLPGLAMGQPVQRIDFWSGHPRPVLEVRITNMDCGYASLKNLYRRWRGLRYYNCDIPPDVHYGYATGLFPTAFCQFEHENGRLLACKALDHPHDKRYTLPPLREVELSATGVHLFPRPILGSLSLASEGRTYTWDYADSPQEALYSFGEQLRRIDPDLIRTAGGDSLLFPAMLSLAARFRIPLELDREPGIRRRVILSGRTYMSYGRILYHAPDYPLFGRWHIDDYNSFWQGEGLEGMVEVARMSKLPVQRVARRSIGSGITSIQLDLAYREGILIPWKKSRPESWKSAAQLIKADRGGLVYQPKLGVYEDVIELDFVSMYPSIMARRNVSPETIDCACCAPSPDLPELGYTICKQRQGLVSRVLGPIIEKRQGYKAMMRSAADPAERQIMDHRQSALKGLLVCCFGYLGYRNARFGRIEAHEAINAFSRELLLRAKEISEERGFEVLHAIVDCLWLRKPGTTDEEVKQLCREIEQATNLTIAIEGRYRWLVFLPSRQNPDLPIPNRYFGCFADGKLKFRGIETRRSDQCPFVRAFQMQLLENLSRPRSLAECRAMRDELMEIVRTAERRLRNYEVEVEALLLRRKTSKNAEEYGGNNMTAVAARQARKAGMNLHAGETVSFLIMNAQARHPDDRLKIHLLIQPEDTYDADYYIDQLHRAAATVLEPIMGESLPRLLGEDCVTQEKGNWQAEQLNFLTGEIA